MINRTKKRILVTVAIFIGSLGLQVNANEFAVGYIAGSYHFDRELSKNENQNGVYMRYKWFGAGVYTNTMHTTSRFVGGQWRLKRIGMADFSISAVIADGYEGYKSARGDYLLIPSIDAKFEYMWISIAPKAAFTGVELDF
ncbi:MAG: hypothetical protein AAF434_20220 [Pseudomonadota bacterium]